MRTVGERVRFRSREPVSALGVKTADLRLFESVRDCRGNNGVWGILILTHVSSFIEFLTGSKYAANSRSVPAYSLGAPMFSHPQFLRTPRSEMRIIDDPFNPF